MKNRWKSAQKEESECWIQHEKKVNTPAYLKLKKTFWHKTFSKIFSDLPLLPNNRVLDFGCGPSGAVLEISDQCQLTCLDSLMDEYLQHFSFLKTYQADYQQGQVETYQPNKTFDVILGFNSLDHVEDIQTALKRIYSLSAEDGIAIFSLNCHTIGWVRWVFSKFNVILDPPHPHQYSQKAYRRMIEENGFCVERIFSLDEETHWINEMTKDKKQSVSFLRSIRQFIAPQAAFFRLMNLFGYSPYGLINEKRIFIHTAFFCRKR